MKLLKKLKGKKTYLAAALAILGAGIAYAQGDVTKGEAAQLVVTGLIGAFLRKGQKDDLKDATEGS